jgi:hypothetical protein
MFRQGKLTDIAVKADGCLVQERPHIKFNSSLSEWTTSARTPGSLPPNIGHKLPTEHQLQVIKQSKGFKETKNT